MSRRFSSSKQRIGVAGLCVALVFAPSNAKSPAPPAKSPQSAQRPAWPFSSGERLSYDLSVGRLHVGSGNMELATGDSIRGHATLHSTFRLRGGMLFFRVDDRIESWFDASTLTSLRFTQQLHEGRYHADRVFDVFPERAVYQQVGDTAQQSVSAPLDDVSFLYFLRTVPLEVGSRYEYNRYFQPEGNPLVLSVLRRERITVPAGTFDAIVVRPEITTAGLFSKDGQAEVWLRADSGRVVLKLRAKFAFTSLTLYLTSIESKAAIAPPAPR